VALPTTRSDVRDHSLVGGEASTALGVPPRLDQSLHYRTAGELDQDPRRPDHQQEAHGPRQPLHQGPCMGYQDQRDIHDDTRQGGDDRADPRHRRRDRPAGDQGRGGRDRTRTRKQAPQRLIIYTPIWPSVCCASALATCMSSSRTPNLRVDVRAKGEVRRRSGASAGGVLVRN
jgi:hypothetical protein